MQSLIEKIEGLKCNTDGINGAIRPWPFIRNEAIDDVIALIKQHERPVDEDNIKALLSDKMTEAYGAGGYAMAAMFFDIVRPCLKQQQPVSAEAYDALKNHQQQLDEDGVMVGVSRQALDELLNSCAAMQGEKGE